MNKLFLVVAACAVTAIGFGPAQAGPDDFQGTILLPTPFVGWGDAGTIGTFDCDGDETMDTAPPPEDCNKGAFSGVHRRLYINAGDATNGVLGYTIPITADGVPFTLASDPPDGADFDLTFYRALGDAPNGEPDTEFGDGVQATFALFGNQAETGTVPSGAKFAIITLWGSANAGFTYTSG